MYIHRRASLPRQTDHSNTGIHSILVNKLVGLYKSEVLLLEASPLTVKAGSSIAKLLPSVVVEKDASTTVAKNRVGNRCRKSRRLSLSKVVVENHCRKPLSHNSLTQRLTYSYPKPFSSSVTDSQVFKCDPTNSTELRKTYITWFTEIYHVKRIKSLSLTYVNRAADALIHWSDIVVQINHLIHHTRPRARIITT